MTNNAAYIKALEKENNKDKRIKELEAEEKLWRKQADNWSSEMAADRTRIKELEAELEDYYKAWEDMDLTKELQAQLDAVRGLLRQYRESIVSAEDTLSDINALLSEDLY